MNNGTIVLAQGASEHIVGIVVDNTIADYPLVAWVSAERGAFTCNEAISDLTVANPQPTGTDPQLDTIDLARLIKELIA